MLSPGVAGLTINMQTSEADKRSRILDGAVKVFLAYGYQRTTMDDIARAAGMSRPALYLQFRNKTDIYRAIATMMLDHSAEVAKAALAGPGDLSARLLAAIDDCMFAMVEKFAGAPHGAEILDMKGSLAGDIVASGTERLGGMIAREIEKEAARLGTDLKARDLGPGMLASLLLDGLEGIKMRIEDPAEQRRSVRGLVRVVSLALQP